MNAFRLTCVLAAVLFSTIARAQETEQIEKVAVPAAAQVKPATRPAREPAKVSPEAEPVLQRLTAAYGRLDSLSLAGKLTFDVEDGPSPRRHESAFTSLYLAPGMFRHEPREGPMLISTGQKLYAWSPRTNRYRAADIREGRLAPDALPADFRSILPRQNPSLLLAIVRDASEMLRALATEITASEQTVDGKSLPVLQLSLERGSSMQLIVDPQSGLVRRAVIDLKAEMARRGRPDITRATLTIDYTASMPGAAVKPEQLSWSPPAHARDLGAASDELLVSAEGGQGAPLVNKPAPDFTLTGPDGQAVTLSKLKGSVVVLDFWATWCGPCRAAMPHLDKLYQEQKEAGLRVFAVNQREDKEKVNRFLAENKLSLPVLLDRQGEVGQRYQVRGIPTTVVIGKDGRVKSVQVGFSPGAEEALRKAVLEQMQAAGASSLEE